jgi:hypothetical protein
MFINSKAEIDAVKQGLKDLKDEFSASELKMKDFAFNKEMVEILLNGQVKYKLFFL